MSRGLQSVGIGLVLVSLLASQTRAEKPSSPLGSVVKNFELQTHRGQAVSLQDFSESKLVVIAFLGTECPLAKLYGPRLAELHKQFSPQGVAFLGINSNTQDSMTEITAYVNKHGISFPMLKDVGNRVADQLGAERTPEVFVLDQERKVRYHGRIDDQYGVGYLRSQAQRRDLSLALEELLAGKEVAQAETEVVGCYIGRVKHVEPTGEITWSNQIVRIFNQSCVECHREGEIAPFTLTSYEDVLGWEDTILEVIADNRMPPWTANPKHGHFSNDPRLSEEEKELIRGWIKNGMPEGDRSQLPEPPQFVKGWRIPQPDQVVYMREEPFDVPREGVVDYQYFVVDPGWAEEKYICATEARPGNAAVVHHIVVYVQPPNAPDNNIQNRAMLVGYAPGANPKVLEDGVAIRVPAGCKLIFELHYTPNGSAQQDRSYVGFRFMDKQDVKQELRGRMAVNPRFQIPPGADNHMVKADYHSSRDELLLSMTPHMHLRGKAFRYEAFYPDGTQEILLDVPRYDFNWQLNYDLAEPKRIPKGTRIECTAWYDNSEHNPLNPDPTQTVRWGDQSFEEMMIGFFSVVKVDQVKTVPTSKPNIDPSGLWTWTRDDFTESLELTLKNNVLTGTLKAKERDYTIENATIQGDKLTFRISIPNVEDLSISFEAKVEKDKIQGEVTFTLVSLGQSQKHPWSAEKQKTE